MKPRNQHTTAWRLREKGLTYAQIAGELHIGERTVRRWLSNGNHQHAPIAQRGRMKIAPSEDRLTYTIEEAAKLLGVGRNTAYDAAVRGEIPAKRIGPKRWIVPRAALEAWLLDTSVSSQEGE